MGTGADRGGEGGEGEGKGDSEQWREIKRHEVRKGPLRRIQGCRREGFKRTVHAEPALQAVRVTGESTRDHIHKSQIRLVAAEQPVPACRQ